MKLRCKGDRWQQNWGLAFSWFCHLHAKDGSGGVFFRHEGPAGMVG